MSGTAAEKIEREVSLPPHAPLTGGSKEIAAWAQAALRQKMGNPDITVFVPQRVGSICTLEIRGVAAAARDTIENTLRRIGIQYPVGDPESTSEWVSPTEFRNGE